MILVVGANGNMGGRYKAILRHLNKSYCGVDRDDDLPKTYSLAKQADGIIIATPTTTHINYLNVFADLGKPILCEKPFSTEIEQVRDVTDRLSRNSCRASMVSQYHELVDPRSKGDSEYDYFKHGQDGLVWDCIQIIGHAKGIVSIREGSPIWRCTINGKKLDLGDMDGAYVRHVAQWLKGHHQDLGEILEFHEKTHDYHAGYTGNANHS